MKSLTVLYLMSCLLHLNHEAGSVGTFRNRNSQNRSICRRTYRDTSSPVPIDCKLKSWTSWTPCDPCTDKTVRFQYLERFSQFGGTECVHSQWDAKKCPEQGECQPQDDCGQRMWACPETGRCIEPQLRCNGDNDCSFGSDEDDCEEIKAPLTKCVGMLPIPGADRATQGYHSLTDVFVNPVLDNKYFGGLCEYVYNGEWRRMSYDAFCENLNYSDDEKYFRMPYNFLSYRLMAHSISEGSTDYFTDASSLLNAIKTHNSGNFGFSVGVAYVEVGVNVSAEVDFLKNISQFNSQEVGFVRLSSRVETAQFKMRSRDLMLHEDMLQSLMELPEQYNFGAYSHFIKEYGTHYVTQGIMGGIMEFVVVVDKEEMKRSEISGYQVGGCIGGSLGVSAPIATGLTAKLEVGHQECKKVGSFDGESSSKSSMIKDVIGYVKGGTVGHSAAQLAFRNDKTYRMWGKSLQYNPAVIDYEALPIYELVRSSTAASQAGTRLPLLKQAWEEYMQQFNPCRCAPCRNNGVTVMSRTSCSCKCPSGYEGLSCEKTNRQGPTHGMWSCWGSWSSCSSGTKSRTRQCNNPAPENKGFPCRGRSVQNTRC